MTALRMGQPRVSGYLPSVESALAMPPEAKTDVAKTSIREATILLDRGVTHAHVVMSPNGDALVIPEYDGAFWYAAQAWQPPEPAPTGDGQGAHENWSAKWDAMDAANILRDLIALKGDEEADDKATIDKAIAAVSTFIKSETDEMNTAVCSSCEHPMDCDCTNCTCPTHTIGAMAEAKMVESVVAFINEAGKRHSSKDSTALRTIADALAQLGILPPAPAPVAQDPQPAPAATPAAEPEAESTATDPLVEANVEIGEAGTPEHITFRESSYDSAIITSLREADPVFDPATKSVWITPIRPGFGNSRDNFYYPTETVREATNAGLFVGKKMYVNHPRKSDATELPERSVKDWFATTKESSWDAQRNRPRVRVVVHDDDAFKRFQEAPEQIAFSIIGGGMARPGKVNGKSTRVVESFDNVASVDWVTEAGAGGALDFMESAAEEMNVPDIKDIKDLDQLKTLRPDLFTEADGDKPAEGDAAPASTAESDAEMPAWFKPFAEKVDSIESRQTAAEQAATRESALRESADTAKGIVTAAIAESTLVAKVKDVIAARYAEATIGDGGTFATEDALREAIGGDLKTASEYAAALAGERPSAVKGLGASADDSDPKVVRESEQAALAEAWGSPAPRTKRKLVFSPDELAGPAGIAPALPTMTRESAADEGEPASLSESGKSALDELAATGGWGRSN